MKGTNSGLKKLNLARSLNIMNVERRLVYLFAIAVALAANVAVSFISLRADFSNGAAYTLSPASRTILSDLDDVVNIKFYASSDIPGRLTPLKTDVTDLLQEYQKAGGRNVRVQILDPKTNQQAEKQAKEAGIPELQFQQLEQDKYAVTTAYFGILLTHGDKKEVIPQATDMGSLEYNLTADIYKMTRKSLANVDIIGYPESAQDPIAALRRVLANQFTVKTIDLGKQAPAKDDKVVLLFDDMQSTYDDASIKALNTYLKGKGTIIAFADGIWVRDNLTTEPANHNLFSFFSSHGIDLHKDLVMSSASELVNFGNENVSFFVPYPYWVKTNAFSGASYFSNIHQLTYPWVSSLDSPKHKASTLVKTTQRSWRQTDSFTLNPQQLQPPAENTLKQSEITMESKQGVSLIVVPSSRFVLDKYLSTNAGNLEFVLNVVNEYASGGALSGIRQREVTFYPLPQFVDSQKDLFKYSTMLLLPILFAGYGAYRITKRK